MVNAGKKPVVPLRIVRAHDELPRGWLHEVCIDIKGKLTVADVSLMIVVQDERRKGKDERMKRGKKGGKNTCTSL